MLENSLREADRKTMLSQIIGYEHEIDKSRAREAEEGDNGQGVIERMRNFEKLQELREEYFKTSGKKSKRVDIEISIRTK